MYGIQAKKQSVFTFSKRAEIELGDSEKKGSGKKFGKGINLIEREKEKEREREKRRER